jgi:hypothetical protein
MVRDLGGNVGISSVVAPLAPHDQPNMNGKSLAQGQRSGLVFPAVSCHIWSMPLPDLPEDEHAELVRLLRDAIAGERYFLSPRMKRLKSILAKIEPASVKATVDPLPAPRPAGEPSLLYRKLRGGGRRRR